MEDVGSGDYSRRFTWSAYSSAAGRVVDHTGHMKYVTMKLRYRLTTIVGEPLYDYVIGYNFQEGSSITFELPATPGGAPARGLTVRRSSGATPRVTQKSDTHLHVELPPAGFDLVGLYSSHFHLRSIEWGLDITRHEVTGSLRPGEWQLDFGATSSPHWSELYNTNQLATLSRDEAAKANRAKWNSLLAELGGKRPSGLFGRTLSTNNLMDRVKFSELHLSLWDLERYLTKHIPEVEPFLAGTRSPPPPPKGAPANAPASSSPVAKAPPPDWLRGPAPTSGKSTSGTAVPGFLSGTAPQPGSGTATAGRGALTPLASAADDAKVTKLPDRHRAILLVMDTSGSMSGDKLTQAKLGAIEGVRANDDPNTWFMLIRFGGDCSAGVSIAQRWTRDRPAMLAAINALRADGGTPLAPALTRAARELRAFARPGQAGVILLADGDNDDSCGTVAAAVGELTRAGARFHYETIGLGVSDAAAKDLRLIASSTGGSYTSAADAGEVRQSFRQSFANLRKFILDWSFKP